MNPSLLKQHLADLCEDLDRGRPLRRPGFAIPAATAAALFGFVLGCAPEDDVNAVPEYGVPMEDCTDGEDNTGNGLVDCEDPQCEDHEACVDLVEDCTDGVDNTGNGLIDCNDPDCYYHEACSAVDYAAPFEDCTDGEDNTGNGLVDCDDPQCRDHEDCAAQELYAAAFEDCTDGVDNTGNGLADCDDPECYDHEDCSAVPEYAAP